MALKNWKRSMHHARPTTKIAWESDEGNILGIDYIPSSNIPYKLISNDRDEVDSTNSFARAMKLASNWRRTN